MHLRVYNSPLHRLWRENAAIVIIRGMLAFELVSESDLYSNANTEQRRDGDGADTPTLLNALANKLHRNAITCRYVIGNSVCVCFIAAWNDNNSHTKIFMALKAILLLFI